MNISANETQAASPSPPQKSGGAFDFDPVVVAEVVEQYGYKLVPQETSTATIVVNVCILLMMLFMLFQLKYHITSLSKSRKLKQQ
jgi:hypothetical protein